MLADDYFMNMRSHPLVLELTTKYQCDEIAWWM